MKLNAIKKIRDLEKKAVMQIEKKLLIKNNCEGLSLKVKIVDGYREDMVLDDLNGKEKHHS